MTSSTMMLSCKPTGKHTLTELLQQFGEAREGVEAQKTGSHKGFTRSVAHLGGLCSDCKFFLSRQNNFDKTWKIQVTCQKIPKRQKMADGAY